MSGCRISKVTDKRTGRSVHMLRPSALTDEQEELAGMLQEWLARVRSGEIRSLLLAGVSAEGDATPTAWCIRGADTREVLQMLAAGQHDILAARS